MKCGNCGAEINERMVFCPKCGTKCKVQPQFSQNSEAHQGSRMPDGSAPAGKNVSDGKPVKKGLPMGAFIGIGAAVLAVAAVIVAIGFFSSRNDNNPEQREPVMADIGDSGESGNLTQGQAVSGMKTPEMATQEVTAPEMTIPEVTIPVTFYLYSCMDVVSDENGTAAGEVLQTATATVRKGAGNYNGGPVYTAETRTGELITNLPSGVYTVQFHTDGYLDGYLEVEVMEEAAVRDVYVMPGLAENQTGVILTWDSDEVDLDLALVTPYQEENGDMAHIGGSVDGDGHGNILVSDNGSRCEAMFINSGEQGSYKLYVNDYTDSVAGNYASDTLYRLNVHVYIYNSNGFVAEYSLPLDQAGVVWEVAEINGRNATPAQRVYSEISGEGWWTENKEVRRAEEDAALLASLQSESSLKELMEILVHNIISEEKINALLRGEQEGIESLFDFARIACSPIGWMDYVRENQPENYVELKNQVWAEHFLTEEQAEYFIYSVCGKQIDYDFSVYDTWIAPYIGFGAAAGDISRDELDQISVERVNANTWKVRAYDVYYRDWQPSRIKSRVCFTVVKNPDSCIDGYSLTGFEVEETADTEWAGAYLEIVRGANNGLSEKKYKLISLDDDMIPELVVDDPYGWITVYTWNGEGAHIILDEGWGTWGRSYNFKPYENTILESCYEQDDNGAVYYYDFYNLDGSGKELPHLREIYNLLSDNPEYYCDVRKITKNEFDSYFEGFHWLHADNQALTALNMIRALEGWVN